MGGTIGVQSQEGAGSTFWFTAVFEPAPPEEPPPADRAADVLTEAPASDARILVVEDNPVNREVVLAQLRRLGYRARAVENGAEAVKAVETGEYSLVLMDCQMPVMDGFEATRRIRGSPRADIPIVAVTANAMPSDRERCLEAGMSDYLSKPVEMGDLGAAVAKWLGTHAEPAETPPAAALFNQEAMLQRLMGDRRLTGAILKSFVGDYPASLNALRRRIAAADAPGTRSKAHTLKGAAATVSAEGLQALAAAIEQAGINGQLASCDELLSRAEEEFERFRSALRIAGWVE